MRVAEATYEASLDAVRVDLHTENAFDTCACGALTRSRVLLQKDLDLSGIRERSRTLCCFLKPLGSLEFFYNFF